MIVTLGSHQDITRFLRAIRTLSGVFRTIIYPSGLISMVIDAHSPPLKPLEEHAGIINVPEVLFSPLLSVFLWFFVSFS